jgi:outer membrane protein
MKRPLFLFALLAMAALLPFGAQAQKFGYLDSQAVLEKMTEYQAVQREMDDLSKRWQGELDNQYAAIEKMYNDYRAKEVLLSKEDKKRLQDDIMAAEKKAREFQNSKFGYDGELFKQREEKMRPIQDKLMDATKAVAAERRLDMILDRAGSAVIFYADPRFDVSADVMRKLGVNPDAANTTTPAGTGR